MQLVEGGYGEVQLVERYSWWRGGYGGRVCGPDMATR